MSPLPSPPSAPASKRAADRDSPAPGSRVAGRYRLLRPLGAGGMGAVHLAVDEWRGGRRVALKSAPLADPAATEALEREFGWLCRLRHPNIVAVHDFGSCAVTRSAWFTMDLAEGCTFLEALAPADARRRAEAVAQLCRALDFVHSRGLVHSDLKSENVLVREDASGALRVRLVDFGLAGEPGELERRAAGRFSGTLSHAAPELVGGEGPAGPAADLYALGVLLFQLHAGRPPFEREDPVALAEAHRREAPPDPGEACPGLSAAARAMLTRLLAKRPAERPCSALAVARAWMAGHEGLEAESIESSLAHVRAPRLIGQEAALSRVLRLAEAAADRAAAGPRSLLLLGPAGSGKSRLLEEAARGAQLAGVRVLSVAASSSSEPFGGLAGLVVELVRNAGEALRPLLPELVKIAPELGAESGVAPSAPFAVDDERLRLGAAVWDALLAAAVRPILVGVDGAEGLSSEAAGLLAYLLRRLRLEVERGNRPPIALLAAGRDDLPEELLEAFRGSNERVRTQALDEPGVERLLGSLFPSLAARAELAELLHRALGGNAALIERWLGSLVREGALRRRPEGWTVDLQHEALRHPPRDLGQAVSDSLTTLEAPERELLLDVSLLPDGMPASLLARLGGRHPVEQERSLDALERASLALAPSRPEGRVVACGSALVRAAARRAWAEPARLRAAALLEAARREGGLGHSARAELAEAAGRSREAAAEWGAALAEATEREDHLRSVLTGRRLAALVEGPERARAMRSIATALLGLGRFEEAELAALEGESAGAVSAEERGAQLELMRDVSAARGRFRRAEELARRRLELLPAGDPRRWEAALSVSRILARVSDADWTEFLPELRDGATDDARRADVELLTGTAFLTRGRPTEAAEALRRALPGCRGDGRRLAMGLNNLGVAELRRGRLAAAARALRESVELRRRSGARVAMSGTLVNLGLLDLERARPAAAARRLREALAVKREAGDGQGALLALTNLAVAELQRQDMGAFLGTLALAAEEFDAGEDPRAQRVLRVLSLEAHHLLGDEDGELRELEAIRPVIDEPSFSAHRPTVLLALARRDLAEGRREAALEILRGLAAEPSAAMADRAEAASTLADELSGASGARRRPLEPPRSPPEDAEEALAVATAALAALDAGQQDWPPGRFALHLSVAGAEDALGRPRGVEAALEAAAELAGRCAGRLSQAELAAARGLAASRREDWSTAEEGYAAALRRLRSVARRVPTALRKAFLDDPRRRGLREALLSVRSRGRARREAAGFFAPLAAAPPAGTVAPRRAGRVLRAETRRLREVIEITRDINALVPVGELLDRILDRVLRLMQAERGFIVLAGEGGALEFAAARDSAGRSVPSAEFAVSRSVLDEVVRTGRPVLSSDARADSRFVSKQSVLLLDLRSVLVAPLVAREQVIGALYVDNSQRAGAFGEPERDVLALFAAQAAVAVENARLHETRIAKDLLDQELSIARGIQERLLPERLPRLPGFRVAASMTPARELGGDYYDALVLPDGRVRLGIGDVSGKGIPAGLVMVMAHSILRSVGFADEPLDRILERANAALEARIEDDKFMTFALLEPALDGRSLKLALAGHEPPLLWRRSEGSVEVLEAGGIALGMLPELAGRLREDRLRMEVGDVLCLYTDGVTECRAPDGRMFGRERLERALAEASPEGAVAVLEGVERELRRFRAEQDRSDDVTLLVLEAGGREQVDT